MTKILCFLGLHFWREHDECNCGNLKGEYCRSQNMAYKKYKCKWCERTKKVRIW